MPLIKVTDKSLDLTDNSISISKLASTPSDTFSLVFCHSVMNTPTASTSYYFGGFGNSSPATSTSNISKRILAPYGATAYLATLAMLAGTAGSIGGSTFSIQNSSNGTSNTLTNNFSHNLTDDNVLLNGFTPFTFSAGDRLAVNWATPSWTTAPLNVSHVLTLWCKKAIG